MTFDSYSAAKSDFRAARQQAVLQQIVGSLTGHSVDLLDYNKVRSHVGATGQTNRGLQEIPLDAIVGSVGRSHDFTRTFLPKNKNDEERWTHVKKHVDKTGMRPILVYKLGDVYFVNDGNHRVSIARQRGMKSIQAYVTEIETKAPLQPDDNPQEIICKARYAEFLTETGLDALRPTADLKMNLCGLFHVLLEQIDLQHCWLNREKEREYSYAEVVSDWYDTVYLPVVKLINDRGVQRNFPRLTETDLYAIVVQHRAGLEEELGWRITTADAVTTLPKARVEITDDQESEARVKDDGINGNGVIDRIAGKVQDAMLPAGLESGPPTGDWRLNRWAAKDEKRIFSDILIAGRGVPADANTLNHALIIAKREGSRMLGLRVVKSAQASNSDEIKLLKSEFHRRCEVAGVPSEWSTETGPITRRIVKRAVFADLVALSLVRESGPRTRTGTGADFSTILQRSPRPILAVPEAARSSLDRVLLAYDGSAKADEALYLAAYMAARWPSVSLGVIVVGGGKRAQKAIARARSYLATHLIPADFFNPDGNINNETIKTGRAIDANLLVMGGFGARPIMQLLVGSSVHSMAKRFGQPLLICR